MQEHVPLYASSEVQGDMSQVLRVTWYRFRATFGRRWPGYLAIVILSGLLGGLAMGSIAGARRTQSSFPVFLASTNPPDLEGVTSFVNPSPGSAGLGYDPALQAKIARLPHVGAVDVESGLNFIPLGKGGVPESPAAFPATAGEVGGLVSDTGRSLDVSAATEGRIFDLRNANEFMVSATTAKTFDLHLGEVVRFGVYTNAQTALRTFGTAADVPHKIVSARLVGIVTSPSAVVEDDTDVSNNANVFAFTPALVRPLLTCCAYYTATALTVTGGRANIGVVAHEISRILPPGFGAFATNQAPALDGKAERAIKPESIALGVFGGVAALAALLIAGQIIGRQLRRDAEDLAVLRAVGAGTAMTTGDSLIGVLSAVVAGSLLAERSPSGSHPSHPSVPSVRSIRTPELPSTGRCSGSGSPSSSSDSARLAFTLAVRGAPHRASARRERADRQSSGVVTAAAKSGLPAPAVAGIRFALESGRGRNTVPVRSAILGAALAVIIVVATVTFGSSLNTLVSHPALYGWNWSYELSANGGGVSPVPRSPNSSERTRMSLHRRGSSSTSSGSTARSGCRSSPEAAHAAVAPPLLSGHAARNRPSDRPRCDHARAVAQAGRRYRLGRQRDRPDS